MEDKAVIFFQCSIAGIVLMLCALCFAHVWPESSYGLASWVQAIGSIVAIAGAGYGIRAQLRHSEQLAVDVAVTARANVIHAILGELKVYRTALVDIDDKINTDASSIFGEMLQMIFPSASFRFPVYTANAANIWAVRDLKLRSKVIGLYAEMDMLFALLDRNSAAAIKIPDGQLPSEEVKGVLKKLHPIIKSLTEELLEQINLVQSGLEDQIGSEVSQ